MFQFFFSYFSAVENFVCLKIIQTFKQNKPVNFTEKNEQTKKMLQKKTYFLWTIVAEFIAIESM